MGNSRQRGGSQDLMVSFFASSEVLGEKKMLDKFKRCEMEIPPSTCGLKFEWKA